MKHLLDCLFIQVFCFLCNFVFISASTASEIVPLPSTSTYAPFASLFDQSLDKNCSARCERLYNRSLKRVGHSIENVASTLRSKASAQDASVICWKFLDYDDCERQCENSSNQAEKSSFSQDRLFIVRKCSKLVARSPYLKHFKCLHRFHTFLQVRCSSYAKEATRYRYLSKLAKSTNGTITINASLMPSSLITKRPRQMRKDRQMSRDTLIQETCRYLHYHSTCLANAVFNHCPHANDLFNRFTLLDYFLSFVVPKNDELFTDRLLDYCQMYDFQKIARDLFDSTKTTVKRHIDENESTTQPGVHGVHVTQPLTQPSTIYTRFKPDKTTRQKSLFSSDEDLVDTPPNFYYSSAKYTKAYTDALERLNFYQTTSANRPGSMSQIDEFDLITHPVHMDFSMEGDEQRQYSKRTPAPIQLVTGPDSILSETQNQRTRGGRRKGGKKGSKTGGKVDVKGEERGETRAYGDGKWPNEESEGEEYQDESEIQEDDDYASPILWPRNNGDEKEYADTYDDGGPLFRNERPHVFRIRQYGIDDHEDHAKVGNNQGKKPHSVKIDQTGGGKSVSRSPYDYGDYNENDHEADDPNEITYPGRREREQTTKAGQSVPSFGDMLRTFVTTALQPTTPNPNIDGRRSKNSLLWLMAAYALFFAAALVILASLIFAMILIRRRRRHEYYKTFLIKKPQRF